MSENKPSQDYKDSDYTSVKQASLYNLFMLHMPVVKAVWVNNARRGYAPKPYLYYDLHGGQGRDSKGKPGSPIVFGLAALEVGIPYEAHVYEKDEKSFAVLKRNCENIPFMTLHNADHNDLIEQFKDVRVPYQYGLVYSDPSNADPAFDVLRAFSKSYPEMDVAINIAGASYKRMRNIETWTRLNEELQTVKPYWIVRKPVGKFQWTVLFGTKWVNHPDYPSKNFFHFNSEIGKDWFLKVVYTNEEIQRTKQRPLLQIQNFRWDTYEDYLASPVFKSIRAIVMHRARGICECCKRRNATEVHHLQYSAWYHGQPDNINNVVAICNRCHCAIHEKAS